MQRWRLTVTKRKGWSKTSDGTASGATDAAIDRILICLVLTALAFSSGCAAEPEGPSEEPLEPVEVAVEETERSAAVDSLILGAGERSVAQRIRDASIAAEVQLALVDDRNLRAFRLEPVVVHGRVVLEGEVQTAAQRDRVESVVSGIAGVREVINRIVPREEPLLAEEALEGDSADRSQDDDASTAAAPAAETSGASPAPEPGEPGSAATYHTVEYGDNLWDIARAYDVSVQQITRLNDLGSNAIKPGQRLQVK